MLLLYLLACIACFKVNSALPYFTLLYWMSGQFPCKTIVHYYKKLGLGIFNMSRNSVFNPELMN